MRMDLTLTSRQSNVLAYIRSYEARYGQAPTLEEIGQALDIASVSAVLKHVRLLEAKGRLTIVPNLARGIRVVQEDDPMDRDTLDLPLIGKIAAGEPIVSTDSVERTVRVTRSLFRLRPDYLLRVVGRSMIGEGIHDGDLVAVKATPVAHHGQVVVARIAGDSFTIKKLFEKDGVVCLLPNSPGYRPIEVDPTEDFAVEGLYAGLIRGA